MKGMTQAMHRPRRHSPQTGKRLPRAERKVTSVSLGRAICWSQITSPVAKSKAVVARETNSDNGGIQSAGSAIEPIPQKEKTPT